MWTYPSIKCVQQRVSCPVCYAAAAVGLASFSVLETLTSKGPLVDLPIFSAAERHAEVLQLGKETQRHDVEICGVVVYFCGNSRCDGVTQELKFVH